MNIPGANLLALALGVIARQPVYLLRFAQNVRQATGVDLAQYEAPEVATGSVQPVSKSNYERLGLDWSKDYVSLFTSIDVRTLGRDGAGDVFIYQDRYYHAQDRTNWIGQDGWNEVLGVNIPDLDPTQIV